MVFECSEMSTYLQMKPFGDQFDGLDMSVISVAIDLTEKRIDEV